MTTRPIRRTTTPAQERATSIAALRVQRETPATPDDVRDPELMNYIGECALARGIRLPFPTPELQAHYDALDKATPPRRTPRRS